MRRTGHLADVVTKFMAELIFFNRMSIVRFLSFTTTSLRGRMVTKKEKTDEDGLKAKSVEPRKKPAPPQEACPAGTTHDQPLDVSALPARTFTPQVHKISMDAATGILDSQLSQFHLQPDGSYVRKYDTFSTEFQRSLRLFLDAGMNLAEIAFHADLEEGYKGNKVPGLDKCKTLADVAPLKVTGKHATVTLTKAQYDTLHGFYYDIAHPPRQTGTPPAAGPGGQAR